MVTQRHDEGFEQLGIATHPVEQQQRWQIGPTRPLTDAQHLFADLHHAEGKTFIGR
jgi:hypothetical protein